MGQFRWRKERKEGGITIPVTIVVILLSSLMVASPLFAEESLIRILHVNDFHGFAEPYAPLGSKEMLGGAAYLAAAVNRLRNERPALLLAAGDMIQGHPWASLPKGESVVELMNAMKFDAMAMGNHEFDFGQDILKKRISEATFPVLGANVLGVEGIRPFVVKEISGVKVGILGILTDETPVITHPSYVAGVTFIPAKEAVERYLVELKKVSNIIIVLSHMGLEADKKLAEEVKGIDAVVGGHSHTKVVDPPGIGGTIILQAWEHGKALGVLDIVYEDGRIKSARGHLEEIKPGGTVDKTVETIVLKYKSVVDSVLNQTIGETEVDLDGENVRKRETNLGNLVADIIREAANADGGLINSGAIRTSIHKGEIKAKDIYSVLPFDNYIVAVKFNGRQLREALEHGVSGVEKNAGAFPQVSGIRFRFDPASPPGSRIREVEIRGKPLDPEQEYGMATNDFIAQGGDGYKAFGDAIKSSKDYSVIGGAMKGEKLVYSDPGRWLRDVVIEYVKSRKKVSPQSEGRITQVEK